MTPGLLVPTDTAHCLPSELALVRSLHQPSAVACRVRGQCVLASQSESKASKTGRKQAILFGSYRAEATEILEGMCSCGRKFVNDGLAEGYVNMGQRAPGGPYILIANDIFVSVTQGLGDVSAFTFGSIWQRLRSQ